MKRAFRLGATSCIYPGDIVANVRQLAPHVDDIELVLFDTDNHGANIPDPANIAALRALARDNALTYTVHLPCDLDPHDARAFEKIFRALDATRPLEPFAYIAHLDGRDLQNNPARDTIARWQADARRALDRAIAQIEPARLCIENLETWSPDFFAELIAAKNLARCVDVGHFWKQRRDPLPHLREQIARTRVVHLHGVDGRDHESLAKQSRAEVGRVLDFLARADFAGVATLEIFSADDLISSQQVIAEWENDSR